MTHVTIFSILSNMGNYYDMSEINHTLKHSGESHTTKEMQSIVLSIYVHFINLELSDLLWSIKWMSKVK